MNYFFLSSLLFAIQVLFTLEQLRGQEVSNRINANGNLKPVPKFTLETLRQAENIILYDNAPLNTGKSKKHIKADCFIL